MLFQVSISKCNTIFSTFCTIERNSCGFRHFRM